MRKIAMVLGVLSVGGLAAKSAEAQVAFGAGLVFGTDTDLGIAAKLKFGLGELTRTSKIEGQVGFDYFFPDGFDYWAITANALYNIAASGSVQPFVGAGLGLAQVSIDGLDLTHRGRIGIAPTFNIAGTSALGYGDGSRIFLNLTGGTYFASRGNIRPYVEGRIEIGDGSQLVLGGGVYFGRASSR